MTYIILHIYCYRPDCSVWNQGASSPEHLRGAQDSQGPQQVCITIIDTIIHHIHSNNAYTHTQYLEDAIRNHTITWLSAHIQRQTGCGCCCPEGQRSLYLGGPLRAGN
jgi:hypothetical protein